MADEKTTDTNPTSGPPTNGTAAPTSATPPARDAWFATLSDDQKAYIASKFEDDTKGLKTALTSERERANGFEKEIAKLRRKVDEGSEIAAQLDKLQADLAAERQRNDFILSAPEKGVANVTGAYKLALADGLVGKDGVDWDTLKAAYPEMFKQPPAQKPPDAGKGTPKPGAPKPPTASPNGQREQIVRPMVKF